MREGVEGLTDRHDSHIPWNGFNPSPLSAATMSLVKGRIPSAFPPFGISQSSHHLLCLPNTLLQTPRADNLQHSGHATNPYSISILPTIFFTQLNQPRQLLQKCLRRFDHPSHLDKLRPDNRILNQFLPECLSRTSMSPCILSTHSTQSDGLSRNTSPLCIEIRHDDLETVVLFVDQVLHGDAHIIKGDECAPWSTDTRIEHLSGRDTLDFERNNQEWDASCPGSSCPDSCCNVVGPDAVRDPLLAAIDDVVIAVPYRSRLDIGYIRAS